MVENLKQIEAEDAIVWLEEAARSLPYVREGIMALPHRMRPPSPRRTSRRIVCYATLRPGAPHVSPGRFQRRYWWLASHDPYSGGGGPIEAVNPQSIAARQLSEPMTAEQWNRNGPKAREW